MSYRTQSQV
jgi:hypothetical protein